LDLYDVEHELNLLLAHYDTLESEVASFFNETVDFLRSKPSSVVDIGVARRVWMGNFSREHIGNRKPDLVLVDHVKVKEVEAGSALLWSDVLAVGEMKASPEASRVKQARYDLVDKMHLINTAQDNRRFALGISLCGTQMRITQFDRGGSITSSSFDIHKNPTKLLQILIPVAANSSEFLGLDATISPMNQQQRNIYVGKEEFPIKGLLYTSPTTHGRGTSVYLSSHQGREVVIKDYWCDATRATEGDLLKKLEGIEGVPSFVDEAEVLARDTHDPNVWVADTTYQFRQHLLDSQLLTLVAGDDHMRYEQRKHMRTVTAPVGYELSWFSSRIELVAVMIKALKSK
jgi:Fungal protein kinase